MLSRGCLPVNRIIRHRIMSADSTNTLIQAEALWTNAKDSIKHACQHIQEMRGKIDRWHHQKWIILSAHHATNCLLCFLLLKWKPDFGANSSFKHWKFPSITAAIAELRSSCAVHLTQAEFEVFELAENLNELRNILMHRIPPIKLPEEQVSCAIISVLTLLKVIERQKLASIEEIIEDELENYNDLTLGIGWRQLSSYTLLIEKLVSERFPEKFIECCPYCGAEAVIDDECHSCFVEITRIRCDVCREEYLYSREADEPQACPLCS